MESVFTVGTHRFFLEFGMWPPQLNRSVEMHARGNSGLLQTFGDAHRTFIQHIQSPPDAGGGPSRLCLYNTNPVADVIRMT